MQNSKLKTPQSASTKDFQGKKVAVLGAGVEGIASALYLTKHGAVVTVLDRKNEEEFNKKDIKRLRDEDIKIITGENYLGDLDRFDIIVRSPGVNLNKILNSEFKILNSVITSQIKLFFDLCPCPIIGVTGTKGKGTTCALIYEMLKKERKDAYLGGNIGRPPFEFLDKLNPHSIVVLELSSFQLLDLTKSPHIAVVLMTTSEHLDYHQDAYEYVDAKKNILRYQTASDAAILNKDYPASRESEIETKGKIFWISRGGEAEKGCFVREKKIVLRAGRLPHTVRPARQMITEVGNSSSLRSPSQFDESSDASPAPSGDRVNVPPSRLSAGLGIRSDVHRTLMKTSSHAKAPRDENSLEEEIISIDEILLPGEHNLENVCAAVMAATLAGVSKETIASVLKTFKGLEHRLELVAEINGVKYYDDSFSTTPETAIAAIRAFKQPEILILGGSSKGSDFTELGKVISEAKNIKAIIGIGVEWQRIKAQFRIQNLEFRIIEGCKNMGEVVQAAAKVGQPSDVVVLSPACASFDMFKNYKDRGEQFKKEVLKLKSK